MREAKENDMNTVLISDAQPKTRHAVWKPRWTVEIGDGDTLGLAIDDGCFVVLYPHGNAWRPGTHVPKEVAHRIAALMASGALG
jgi:hypothetical protein